MLYFLGDVLQRINNLLNNRRYYILNMCIGTFFYHKNATKIITIMAKSINFDAKSITNRVLHQYLYCLQHHLYVIHI